MAVAEGWTVCIEFSVVPLQASGTVGSDVVLLWLCLYLLHVNVCLGVGLGFSELHSFFRFFFPPPIFCMKH